MTNWLSMRNDENDVLRRRIRDKQSLRGEFDYVRFAPKDGSSPGRLAQFAAALGAGLVGQDIGAGRPRGRLDNAHVPTLGVPCFDLGNTFADDTVNNFTAKDWNAHNIRADFRLPFPRCIFVFRSLQGWGTAVLVVSKNNDGYKVDQFTGCGNHWFRNHVWIESDNMTDVECFCTIVDSHRQPFSERLTIQSIIGCDIVIASKTNPRMVSPIIDTKREAWNLANNNKHNQLAPVTFIPFNRKWLATI